MASRGEGLRIETCGPFLVFVSNQAQLHRPIKTSVAIGARRCSLAMNLTCALGLLRLEKTAAKAAYRKMCLVTHPDKGEC